MQIEQAVWFRPDSQIACLHAVFSCFVGTKNVILDLQNILVVYVTKL